MRGWCSPPWGRIDFCYVLVLGCVCGLAAVIEYFDRFAAGSFGGEGQIVKQNEDEWIRFTHLRYFRYCGTILLRYILTFVGCL